MTWNLPKLIVSATLLLILASPAFAGLSDDLARNKAEQDRLQGLINSSRNQENTLSNQIGVFNNQIRLTQLQIDAKQAELDSKEAELASLNTDIGVLSGRITNLEADLANLAKIAVRRFRTSQAIQGAAPIGGVFLSGDFGAALTNLSYLEYVQHKDQELFQQMLTLKSGLSVQKSTLQDRQAQVVKLRDDIKTDRDDLASAKAQLDSQKAGKVQLLRVTQNDEARYQRLLEAARKEAEQIVLAYNNKGGSRWVHKGEPIGTEGCTGYCTGTHLHFGLYNSDWSPNGSVNPCQILSCDVKGDTGYVRSGGNYRVPINWDGTNYADVSQWWGMTWFARWPYYGYSGGPHTGIDMYTYQGDTVYAAQDGQAYFSRSRPGYNDGNGVFIYHPDGHVTLYWHLN